jgi:hypothetical protein
MPVASCGAGLQQGAPWPMFGRCPSVSGRSPAVGPTTASQKWVFADDVSAPPAVAADGTLYVATAKGSLYALSPDGSTRWTFSADPGVELGGTPAIRADGSILVGAMTTTSQGGAGFIGELYAVSPDGDRLWVYSTGSSANDATPIPAVGDDGTIYISIAYHLYAIHPDGSAAWQADAGGEYALVPAIGPGGTVYGSGQDGLQAFGPGGQLLWTYGSCAGLSSECTTQPVVANDGSILTTVSGESSVLTDVRADGSAAWTLPTSLLSSWLLVGTDGAVVSGVAGGLQWTSANGHASPSVQTKGSVVAQPVIDAAGTVYAGTMMQGAAPCGLCGGYDGAGVQAVRSDATTAWVFASDMAFGGASMAADGTLYVVGLGVGGGGEMTHGAGLYAIGP